MDKAKLIDKLNEILKWEYAGLVQYTQFSFLVQDTWREVYYKFFRKNGEEALDHAHIVGDKITSLGGVPTVERGPSSNQLTCTKCSNTPSRSRVFRSSSTPKRSSSAVRKTSPCALFSKTSAGRSRKASTTSKNCSRSASWPSAAKPSPAARKLADPPKP